MSACSFCRAAGYNVIELSPLIFLILSFSFCLQSELFQEDLFPPCQGDKASMSAAEWISGTNRGPINVSLRDGFTASAPKEFVAPEKKSAEEVDSAPKSEKEVSHT